MNQELPFDDSSENRTKRLAALWKVCAPCSTRDFTGRAVDAGLWDDEDDIRELRIKAHMPEVRAFLDWVNPITGVQRGYKTAEGIRKPPQLCLFDDLSYDIMQDAKQGEADRERLRQKIRHCLASHQRRPEVPVWIWGPDDDAQWNQRAA